MSLNDPRWGNQGNDDKRGDRNRDDNQGPPDLEEVWRDFNQKISGMFGGKRGGGGNGSGGPQMPQLSSKEFGGAIWFLIALIFIGWLITGFYTVNAYERAVVFRFGKIQEVAGPGWHWRFPYPVESHEKVDKTGVRVVEVGYRNNESNKIPREALMLTDDENIINIQFAVQYDVADLSVNTLSRTAGVADNAASAAVAATEETDSGEAATDGENPAETAADDATETIPDVAPGEAAADLNAESVPVSSGTAAAQPAPVAGLNRDPAVENYLVTNRNPDEAVRQAAESAMREIVGRNVMDFVLYEGRDQIAVDAQDLMQRMLDNYHLGVRIIRVTMQNAQPPEQVQAAFDDAVRAGQDLERQRNEGQTYKNSLDQITAGRVARIEEEARAYQERVISRAEGEASRFEQIYTEFKHAPEVTRERLYLETMQQVLSASGKVFVDAKSGGNVLLMPLDKLMQQSTQTIRNDQKDMSKPAGTTSPLPSTTTPAPVSTQSQSVPVLDIRDREALRNRGGR